MSVWKIPYTSDESAEVVKTYCEMSIIHKYKNRFFMTLKETRKNKEIVPKKKKKTDSNVVYPVHLSPFESDSSFYIVDLRYPVTKLNISLQTRELSTEQQDAEISFKA